MDNPIFKLEKVVQAKGSEPLEDFEGPLDLILFLLSKNKIEIQDIPIALILDQYQEYLEQRKQMDLEVASEFVAMAAHLMYIKTRMLLNLEDEEAQSEMDALIKSLEERQRGDIYARVKVLTARLAPMSEFGRDILTRPPEVMERGKIYEYDQQPGDLIIAMQEVSDRRGQLDAQPDLKPFDEIVRREPYSVETKAQEIFRRLRASSGSFCCSGAAAAAARSWRPLWRCWNCAAAASSVWPPASTTAPWSAAAICRMTGRAMFEGGKIWIRLK